MMTGGGGGGGEGALAVQEKRKRHTNPMIPKFRIIPQLFLQTVSGSLPVIPSHTEIHLSLQKAQRTSAHFLPTQIRRTQHPYLHLSEGRSSI